VIGHEIRIRTGVAEVDLPIERIVLFRSLLSLHTCTFVTLMAALSKRELRSRTPERWLQPPLS
jgi:hypothetical protein